jgi:hypothetical protein
MSTLRKSLHRSLAQINELKINSSYAQKLIDEKNPFMNMLQQYTVGSKAIYSIFYFARNPSESTLSNLITSFKGNLDYARYMLEGINNIILGAPKLSEDVVVYRGLLERPIHKNDMLVDMGMSSTSLNKNIALRFSEQNGHILKITIPRSCPLLVLKDISKVATKENPIDEYEIVLPFGSSFRIISMERLHGGNITQYNVEYMCDTNPSALDNDSINSFIEGMDGKYKKQLNKKHKTIAEEQEYFNKREEANKRWEEKMIREVNANNEAALKKKNEQSKETDGGTRKKTKKNKIHKKKNKTKKNKIHKKKNKTLKTKKNKIHKKKNKTLKTKKRK